MRVFLVVGASNSWHASGWGAAVRDADHDRVLVSFVEYVKSVRQDMALEVPPGPYKPIVNVDARNVEELSAFIQVAKGHRETLDETGNEDLPSGT